MLTKNYDINSNIESDYNIKKRKNDIIICQNGSNIDENADNIAEKDKVKVVRSLNKNNDKMIAWVKALFTIYPTIPNIISVIDNIVLTRASSSISMSSVYSGSGDTMKQIEKVIDLSERKLKLLNILALVKEIISPLSEKDYEIVDLRFFRRLKAAEIAEMLKVDERTVFRKVNRILEKAVKICSSSCYDLLFIENAVRGESWIKEIYNKSIDEINSNQRRSVSNKVYYKK